MCDGIGKGGDSMGSSRLVAIIKRLEAMKEATDNEVQVRRFERDGVEQCTVTYDLSTNTFEILETESQQVYQFDDLDLVAIEIFELLQD